MQNFYKTYGPLLMGLMLLSIGSNAQAVRLSVNNWNETLNASDLVFANEAGSDLNSTVETASDFSLMEIRNVGVSRAWKITVSKQDINWNVNLLPAVIRSGLNEIDAGLGVTSGSTSYVQVTDVAQDYIFGTGEVTNIELGFRVQGISLALPAQYYQTRIVFTLFGE